MTWVTTQVCLSGVIVFVVKVAPYISPRPINTGHRTETAAKAPQGHDTRSYGSHAATALISQVIWHSDMTPSEF